jgi:hypothetical protein
MKPSLLVALGALIAGCAVDEPINPVPRASSSTGSTSATSSTTGGAGGAGGMGSGGSGGAGVGGSAPQCPSCGTAQAVGTLMSDKLGEVSGLVASQSNPGVFFVHNDSGDKARFFAVNGGGELLATFDLGKGASAIDWEDIALGPCPTGRCVYLADTGDNLKERKTYTIYRVPEPTTLADQTLPAEAFPFTYPDGAHDCETLLVHPVSGVVTLVAKTFGLSEVYDLPSPLTPGASVEVVKRGMISLPIEPALVTGGDVHPDARGVLLRTYSNAYYFPIAKGGSVADALLGEACEVPLAFEPQGEAIGWLHGGDGYMTVSEGQGAALSLVNCPAL